MSENMTRNQIVAKLIEHCNNMEDCASCMLKEKVPNCNFQNFTDDFLNSVYDKYKTYLVDVNLTRELPKLYDVYKHFKGDLYVIIDIATHTETGEILVIYGRENKTWARPLKMFMSKVDHEKYPDVEQKYRFERC